MMRVLFLGNNRLAWRVLTWLSERGEEIAGLVIHPHGKRKYGDEIISSAGLDPSRIFDGSQLGRPEVVAAIRALRPDMALSVMFGYILKQDFIESFPAGVINLHPGYLPYNRGAYPNVWSIIENTPAGASLHYIDPGIDTGDLIAQRRVSVEPVDTGGSLYLKLEDASLELFKETWPAIRAGEARRAPQPAGTEGTSHRTKDVAQVDEIDLERTYTARALIDLIRARTFPPYRGAYFNAGGRKVYVRLQLCYEDAFERECAR